MLELLNCSVTFDLVITQLNCSEVENETIFLKVKLKRSQSSAVSRESGSSAFALPAQCKAQTLGKILKLTILRSFVLNYGATQLTKPISVVIAGLEKNNEADIGRVIV